MPNKNATFFRAQRGFTLVEVMFAILIALIVMAAMTGVFIAHSRSYTRHEDISGLQQIMRGVMMLMPAEMRLAGCDPTGKAHAGIEKANATEFEFTMDIGGFEGHPNDANGDTKDPGERVAYKFERGKECDGATVAPGGTLCRRVQETRNGMGEWSAVAGNIDRLEFNYIMENGNAQTKPNRSRYKDIRAVQISLLARSELTDPRFTNTVSYSSASGANWNVDAGDESRHRRRLLLTTIQLRNMGYAK